jgi:hypothetical protein
MRNTLTIKLKTQFSMQNKVSNKRQTRYAYTVHGSKEELALFRNDVTKGTCGAFDKISGQMLYYSWLPPLAGKSIERNDTKGTWHIDDMSFGNLEYLAQKSPEALRLLGTQMLDRLFGAEAPEPQEETLEEPEEAPEVAPKKATKKAAKKAPEDDGLPF